MCVVQVAGAKASILWLVGEYCTLVPKIAPDILRKAAKDFINEVLMAACTQLAALWYHYRRIQSNYKLSIFQPSCVSATPDRCSMVLVCVCL